MIEIVMILGVIGVAVQLLTRKQSEENKPLIWVVAQYSIMTAIIVLSAVEQVQSSKEDKNYKLAQVELDVISKVNSYFIPVMKNIITIQNNILSVKSFLDFERAKENNPDLAAQIDWDRTVNKRQRDELMEARKAFDELQEAAANIITLQVPHAGVMPSEIIKWSEITVDMKFKDIETYIDPYFPVGEEPKGPVVDYHDLTGKAFGAALGKSIRIVSSIKQNG